MVTRITDPMKSARPDTVFFAAAFTRGLVGAVVTSVGSDGMFAVGHLANAGGTWINPGRVAATGRKTFSSKLSS